MLRDTSGEVIIIDGNELHVITTCNFPVGSQQFIKGYLSKRMTKITSGFESVRELLNPGRWPHPETPSRQMLWILTVVCLQFMGDYWLRHVRPDFTEKFAQQIEDGIHQLLETTIGMNTSM